LILFWLDFGIFESALYCSETKEKRNLLKAISLFTLKAISLLTESV